jgi:hypothetical protein
MMTLNVELPSEGYHQNLISCQVACPVGTDARGYIRAIAEGRFDEAYLIARDRIRSPRFADASAAHPAKLRAVAERCRWSMTTGFLSIATGLFRFVR